MGVYSDLFSSLFSIVVGILSLIAYWKIYEKAGEEGWKAIIPIYGTYVLYRLTWDIKMFWIMFGGFMGGFLLILIGLLTPLTAIAFLGLIAILIALVIDLFQSHALSRSFGHGLPFTLGLLFLTPVFLLILAFGSSEYQEPSR